MRIFNVFFFICLVSLFATSCTKDKCNQTVTYTKYTPIYVTLDELRAEVHAEAPRNLENPGKIYFYQDHIFINEIREGIHIFDNSDPENPTPISFLPLRGNLDMVVKNDQLIVDQLNDIATIDISDINQPRLLGRQIDVFNVYSFDQNGILVGYDSEEVTEDVDCDWNGRNGGVLVDNAFFADFNQASREIGIPNIVASGDLSAPSIGIAGSFARFSLYEDFLYVAQNWEIKVFDIEDPSNPVEGVTVGAQTNSETAYVYRDHLFIGGTTGMNIFDLSDPRNPTFISGYSHMVGCDPVAISGDYAYVTIRQGNTCRGNLDQLDVLDISDIFNPILEESFRMDNPHGLAVTPEALFLCEGESGLKVFDNSDPLTVGDDEKLLTHFNDFEAYDVIYLPGQEDVLLLIGADGFYQFDVSNPAQPVEISHIPVIRS